MKIFTCKCGSTDIFIEQSGNNIGLYCADCGKWIKWLNKDELRLANRQIKNTSVWKEVLTEFEIRAKEYSNKMEDAKDESDKDFFNGQSLAYFDAYAFIKQKLLENDNG